MSNVGSAFRREVLAGGVTIVGGCLGTSEREPGTESDGWETPAHTPEGEVYETASSDGPTGGRWPQFGYDGGNTGYNPDWPVPTAGVSERWRSRVPGFQAPQAPVLDEGWAIMQSGRTEVAAYDVSRGAKQWVSDVGGRTYGFSPAVQDGRVFVAASKRGASVGQTGTGELSDGLHALSLTDGDSEWTVQVRPLSSPVVTDDGVYVATQPSAGTKSIVRYDPSDGTEAWTYTCTDGCTAPTNERDIQPVHRHRPAVSEERVFLTSVDEDGRGRLRALQSDGTVDWTVGFDEAIISPPVVGEDVVFAVVGHTLRAIESETGERRWQQSLPPGSGPATHLIPATDGTSVYATGDQSVLAFAVDDGTERWRNDAGYAYRSILGPRLAVSDTHLVASWKTVRAIETDTGSLAWEFQNPGVHHAQYTGAVLAEGGVIVGSCIKEEPSDYYDISVHQLSP
jgi:hypothetical protein